MMMVSGSPQVFVVDDDPSVLATYCRAMRRLGCRCESADDPRSVLDALDRVRNADLILLDYKMPGMDGLTLLAELRRREIAAPAVLVSAFLNEDVRRQADVLGVARILDKPIDVRELRQAIAEVLDLEAVPRRLGASA